MRRHIMRNQGTGTDHCALADRDAAHDNCAASDRSARTNPGFFQFPIAFSLHRAVTVNRARMAVVDENHTVSDKHAVFDHYARADEGMTRNLASLPDTRLLLNLHKRADTGVVA